MVTQIGVMQLKLVLCGFACIVFVFLHLKSATAQSSFTNTVPATITIQTQPTPVVQSPTSVSPSILSESAAAILLNIIPAIIIAIISAALTYFFGIRQVRYQLEVELHNEYEITRQRLKADLEKEYQSRFNEKKWELYIKFANIVREQMESIKLPKSQQQKKFQDIVKQLYGFVGELWIVGNDEVVEAFNEWRKTSSSDSNSTDQTDKLKPLVDVMQIVIEMRRDLGYESSKIEPEDLLRTFVNDFDDYKR